MGNKLIVRVRKVLERNPSASHNKVNSIAYGTNLKIPTIQTEHESVVDNLGNFTRSASGSVRSSKILENRVSWMLHFF